MPLSLEEAKSLIAALGVQIAANILQQKAQAEEFEARQEKIAVEAGKKPAEWQFKQKFDELLKQAREAAGKQELDAALKLLEEVEAGLQQPDVAPVAVPAQPATESAPELPKPAAEAKDKKQSFSKARQAYVTALSKAQQHGALLKVIPKATPSNLLAQIERAETLAQPGTDKAYEDATAELKGCEEEFNRQRKTAEKLQKDELKLWEKKPEVQSRLAELKSLYARLESLPGIDQTLKDYAEIIKSAEAIVARDGNFIAASAKLDEVKAKKLPDEKACLKESKKALGTLESSKDYQDCLAALAKLRSLVPEDTVAPLAREFQQVVKRIVGDEGQKALKDLPAARDKLQSEVDRFAKLDGDFAAARTQLMKDFGDFKKVASQQEIALFQMKLERFDTAHEAKRLEEATALGTQLRGELQAGLPPRKAAFDEWQKRQSEVKELAKKITTLQSSKCRPVKEQAIRLMNFVAPHEIKRLTEDQQWTSLLNGLKQTADGIAALTAMEADFAKFQKERAVAGVQVQSAIAAAKTAITEFQAAVNKAAKAKGDGPFQAAADFQSDLDAIKAAWERTMSSAVSEKDLNLGGTLAAIAKIEKGIESLNTEPGIKGLLAGNTQKKALEMFEKDWLVLQNEITKLQAFDNQAALDAQAEAKKLRDQAASDYVAGVTALAQLNSRIGKDQARVSQARDGKAASVSKLAGEVLAAIDDLKKSTAKAKKFGPTFDALKTEHAELVLLGQSTNSDAIGEAEQGLKALQARIQKFAKDGSGTGVTLDEVADRLTQAEKELKKLSDDLSKTCPKQLKTLNERLAALKKSVPAQDPAISAGQIEAFGTQYLDAQTQAKQVVELRDQFKKALPPVKKSLETFTSGKSAPEYAKALKQRFESLQEASKSADNPAAAKNQLEALETFKKELEDATLDGSSALVKEGQLREKAKAAKAASTEWDKSLKLFHSKRVRDAQAAIDSNKGDKSLLQELKNMVSAAEETAKNGDHAQALKQLKLADRRVDEIIKNPYGATIGSRNDLPKDAAVYKEAIQEFRGALNAFPEEVAKTVPDLPQPVTQRMQGLLTSLGAKFDPAQFDASVFRLGSEDLDEQARRAQRESALAQVRNAQAALANNPLLISLAKNPIASDRVSAALRRLDSSLTRLEANISRCCK